MEDARVIRAGIINVTGYVGAELARLLGQHPGVQIVGVTGRSQAGKRLPEVFPHLWSLDLPIEESLSTDLDVAVLRRRRREGVRRRRHRGRC